jgi:hypothetical protein
MSIVQETLLCPFLHKQEEKLKQRNNLGSSCQSLVEAHPDHCGLSFKLFNKKRQSQLTLPCGEKRWQG